MKLPPLRGFGLLDIRPVCPENLSWMVRQVINFLERKLYTDLHFSYEAQVLRTLIKFIDDHADKPLPADSPFRACLASLEKGEKTEAVTVYRKMRKTWGKDSIAGWWPPVKFPGETPESVTITFNCLFVRFQELMDPLWNSYDFDSRI